jgi:hypothetical protein
LKTGFRPLWTNGLLKKYLIPPQLYTFSTSSAWSRDLHLGRQTRYSL